MEHFTPLASLFGGIVIGLATSLVLVSHGRIAGISGIAGGILKLQKDDTKWRMLFVAGLLSGGFVYSLLWPSAFAVSINRSTPTLIAAGLLVGVGTQMGNGCTSGHGICGLSRFSARSLVAVLTFLTTAATSVAQMNAFGGGQ
ncbi:MAG: YeeE/YedE family protein [Polyangiales bacterium]